MNPAPSLQGSLWNGNQQLATKNQLISSISGLYNDFQDIELSTIKVADLTVSSLTASQYISSPFINVSTLHADNLDVSGLLIDASGIFYAQYVSSSLAQFNITLLSSLQFKFDPTLNVDVHVGEAFSGFLLGLGGLLFETLLGLGGGLGLTFQGIGNGLASMIWGRGGNTTYINNQFFELLAGNTQIQVSTLGNAYPLYSSITRFVSSPSANGVPGQEIFVSSFFQPGTTCIRSISDPFPLVTTNSNINTSTIQSFGQWVPFLDPTVAGEDIYARKAQFSSLSIFNSNTVDYPLIMNMSNTNGLQQILSLVDTPNNIININAPFSQGAYAGSQLETMYQNRVNFNNTVNFLSTPFIQYTSTIGTYNTSVYFLTSTITTQSTIPKFTYIGSDFGGGNFAVCEPDETSFISTYTLDLVAESSNVLLQWGLAVDNRNSTIAQGTAKRITWDNTANTSNFIDIPVPQSTVKNFALAGVTLEQHPLEARWLGQYTGDGLYNPQGGMAFGMKTMTFGDITTFNNQSNYPYQFNGNVFVNGTLEADQLVALSTFTSTNIVNFFSTVQLDADFATIEEANISSLQTNFIGGDQISSFGIETYNSLSQFSYISTLVVDFQILEGTTGGVTTNLNNIQGTVNSSRINMGRGTFSNLSSLNASTGSLFASVGTIPSLTTATLSASNASFSNLTLSNTLYGNNLFGQFLTLSTTTTSTLNVNTISTTSHSGSDITCDNITINDFATFPSVANGSNIISMTFSNTTNSNSFNPLQATIIQGSVFPQTSNQFTITTSGSNTEFNDREALLFTTTTGTTATFGGNIDTITVNSGDIEARSIRYGTTVGGFLQPRAFAMSNTTSFGAGTTITASGAVTDGTNTFLGADYNCIISLRSFAQTNGAVAYNSVIIVPYIDAGTQNWYWSLQADINVGSAGGDGVFSWNVLLFPYDMMT